MTDAERVRLHDEAPALTSREIREIAERHGAIFYARLKKADLVQAFRLWLSRIEVPR